MFDTISANSQSLKMKITYSLVPQEKLPLRYSIFSQKIMTRNKTVMKISDTRITQTGYLFELAA
jgi:hypothetical protein